jgi:cyanamide hydratase
MSFEFYGGLLALDLLKSSGAPLPQAENVAETIIRHQDLGETGTVTQLCQVILLATVFDNVGLNPELITTETIQQVVQLYPRNGWTKCFADTVGEECALKPWAHTTAIDGFAEKIMGNTLMAPYDK